MLKRPGSACEDAMGGEKLPGESMFNLRKSPYFLSFASSRRARRSLPSPSTESEDLLLFLSPINSFSSPLDREALEASLSLMS